MFLYIVENITKIFIFLFFIVFINYFADIFNLSSYALRVSLWLVMIVFSIVFIMKIILKIIYLKTANEDIAILIQKKNSTLKDDLINAIQLKNNKYSETSSLFAEEFVRITSSKISKDLLKKFTDFKPLKNIIIVFLIFLVNFALFFNSLQLKRYLIPFLSAMEIAVLPGDISVNLGSDVNIRAVVKPDKSTPYLYFREANSEWHKKKMKKTGKGEYAEAIEKITDNTEYYVVVLDNKSHKYDVKITSPFTIADIKLEYIYPSYIGLPDKIVEESDIEAPVGTTVKITAQTNKKAKEAFLITDMNEKNKMDISKNLITSQFVIQNQTEYWIEAVSIDGDIYRQPVKYKVSVTKNSPPVIEIVAPACDIIVSENEKLKIIYSAEDDFGISEINIDYLTLKKQVKIKSFIKPTQKILDDYEISVADLGLKPGDVIQYRLEVADNNIYPAHLTGNSKTYSIEVMSYEMEHKIIEDEISDFNRKLQEILSRQLQSRTSLAKRDIENAANMQKNAQELMNKATDEFSKTVEKMANDPLTDYNAYSEYKNLLEAAKTIGEQKMNEAEDSLSNKQYDNAERVQDEIIEELKRLGVFSEDIAKKQKMEDMLSTVRDMADTSSDIEQNLKDMKNFSDPEKMKKLQEANEKLSKLMEELSKKVSEMPQKLPEDFANDENVKKIDLTEMRSAADEMKWSLQSGNIDKAIELAEKLSKQISDILNTMENSSNSTTSSAQQKLQKETEESLNDLDKIVEEQRKILNSTQELDMQRAKKILSLQKELLKKLVEKQKLAMSRLNDSKTIIEKSTTTHPSVFNLYVQPETQMGIVLKEFTDEKIEKSNELLITIIAELENISKNVNIKKSAEYVLSSKTIEQEILNELKKFAPPKTSIFTENDLEKHNQLSKTQKLNQKQAQLLHKKVLGILSKTLSIPSDAAKKILSSQEAMGSASDELSNANDPSAVDFEKKALNDLLSGKEGLEGALSQMGQASSMGGKGSMGMGGKFRTRGNRGNKEGGYTGFREGFVKIPSIDEYKPPKEFRESIIESLRQKYPQKYETIIKDYFKRLIE
ncbi:MAG: DUF4175 family protein [Elusimicrobia bacterium]|nr:DUF4175 family protein [Elusimicrobiota bacterium]